MGTAQIIMPENYIAMFDARRRRKPDASWPRRPAGYRPFYRRRPGGPPLSPPHDRLYDRFMSGPVNPIFYACFVKSSAFTVSRPAPAAASASAAVPPTASPSGTPGPSGAKAAPTAWPVSATAPRPPSSTEKEPPASPGITLRPCKPPVRRWPPATFPQRQISWYCS